MGIWRCGIFVKKVFIIVYKPGGICRIVLWTVHYRWGSRNLQTQNSVFPTRVIDHDLTLMGLGLPIRKQHGPSPQQLLHLHRHHEQAPPALVLITHHGNSHICVSSINFPHAVRLTNSATVSIAPPLPQMRSFLPHRRNHAVQLCLADGGATQRARD